MPIFKLTKQELIKQWWNDFYEVEANTLEEAIQKILDYEEDPYDSEPIIEIQVAPERIIILDENRKEVYDSEQLWTSF